MKTRIESRDVKIVIEVDIEELEIIINGLKRSNRAGYLHDHLYVLKDLQKLCEGIKWVKKH